MYSQSQFQIPANMDIFVSEPAVFAFMAVRIINTTELHDNW